MKSQLADKNWVLQSRTKSLSDTMEAMDLLIDLRRTISGRARRRKMLWRSSDGRQEKPTVGRWLSMSQQSWIVEQSSLSHLYSCSSVGGLWSIWINNGLWLQFFLKTMIDKTNTCTQKINVPTKHPMWMGRHGWEKWTTEKVCEWISMEGWHIWLIPSAYKMQKYQKWMNTQTALQIIKLKQARSCI